MDTRGVQKFESVHIIRGKRQIGPPLQKLRRHLMSIFSRTKHLDAVLLEKRAFPEDCVGECQTLESRFDEDRDKPWSPIPVRILAQLAAVAPDRWPILWQLYASRKF